MEKLKISKRFVTKSKLGYIDRDAAGECAVCGNSLKISSFSYFFFVNKNKTIFRDIKHGMICPPICHDLLSLKRTPTPFTSVRDIICESSHISIKGA